MKKNISINISGIIFHIEEEGYETLKEYLQAISAYFSSYEDHQEIVSDIESRIAEIFLAKLDEHRQVITLQDVNELIANMGQISDFEAAEAIYESPYEPAKEAEKQEETVFYQEYTGQEQYEQEAAGEAGSKRKLYRDQKRKLVGGVASGVAHYLRIDPIWIRLLFILPLLLLIMDVFNNADSLFIMSMVLYCGIWFFVPASDALEEDTKVKRLFRDPEDQVIGGVSSGLAAYFGIDATIVRVLFVAGMFLGAVGLIIYLIIWFTTPEAKSITERMQMEGEPITLENIEKKIKDSFQLDEEGEESWFARVLLFPFRCIAAVLTFLSENLKPVAQLLFKLFLVVLGVVLALESIFGVLVLSILLFLILGLLHNWDVIMQLQQYVLYEIDAFDLEVLTAIRDIIPVNAAVSVYVTSLIPLIFLGIIGFSLISRRIMISKLMTWGLLSVWVLGIIGTVITVPAVAMEFKSEGVVKEVQYFALPAKGEMLRIALNDIGTSEVREVNLTIRGHDKETIEMIQRTSAKGKSRQEALDNARAVRYQTKQEGNLLSFDSKFTLPENQPFRVQSLDINLYLPYHMDFEMDPALGNILNATLYPNGYRVGQLEGNFWTFNQEGLRCLSCPDQHGIAAEAKEGERVFSPEEFSFVTISGMYDVTFREGPAKIQVKGREEDLQHFELKIENKRLLIENQSSGSNDKIELLIQSPEIVAIDLSGRMYVKFHEFHPEVLHMNMEGAINCEAEMFNELLNLKLSGASEMKLKGRGEVFNLEVDGASQVDAFDYPAEVVNVQNMGMGKSKVYAQEVLNISSSYADNVSYKGSPEFVQQKENWK
ncbi:PspC domain-containing protein [Rapidithrix thailandica]|uniref:PspC domain-containing protein n=1 Tax=Rapidithrix thailandica TaxID=413964 RepID=A0AAW9S5H1_9BACT